MLMTNAIPDDCPRIIQIYNHAVSAGRCTTDTAPTTVAECRDWLEQHTSDRFPIRLILDNDLIVG